MIFKSKNKMNKLLIIKKILKNLKKKEKKFLVVFKYILLKYFILIFLKYHLTYFSFN